MYVSQDLSRTYLVHHEPESVVIIIIIIIIININVITCVCVYYRSGQQLHSSGKRGQAHGQHLPACAAESGSYATGVPGTVEDKPCGRHWASHMVCTKAISASNFDQKARQFDQIAGNFDPVDPIASKLDQITNKCD